MADIFDVRWNNIVSKELKRMPSHIARKFYAWVSAVRLVGLRKVRQSHGFHDEPLSWERRGERSVRLNRAYRAIYRELRDGTLEIIEVLEVTHHEY